MTSPLRQVTPEERLLETMRLITGMAAGFPNHQGWGKVREIRDAALVAIEEYEQTKQAQPETRYSVIAGEIQSKGGR